MTCRELTASEVPLLEPLIRSFFAEGAIDGEFNPIHATCVLQRHLTQGSGFCLVAGDPIHAGICGMLSPDMGTGEQVALEWFWYVMPEKRGPIGLKLLAAFEAQCWARGAKRIMMMHHVSPKTEVFRSIYERRGYRLREQIFVRGPPCVERQGH